MKSFDLFLAHVQTLLVYAGMIAWLTGSWHNIWLTVVMLAHGIVLIFVAYQTALKALISYSILLFVLTALKLAFVDWAVFTEVERIIVLFTIAILFVVAAIVFLRYRDKFDHFDRKKLGEGEV